MTNHNDQERAQFEATFAGKASFERNEHHPDTYAHLPCRQMWEAWQARAQQPASVAVPEGWLYRINPERPDSPWQFTDCQDAASRFEKATNVEVVRLAAAPHPVSGEQKADTLSEICDLFMIGKDARTHAAIMANIENTHKFANLLHAIEGEFFMVPCEPGEHDDPDEDQQYECLLNCFGHNQEQYIEQFRKALEMIRPSAPPAAQDVSGLIDVATGKIQHASNGLCPDQIEGFEVSDPDCPACRIITAHRAQPNTHPELPGLQAAYDLLLADGQGPMQTRVVFDRLAELRKQAGLAPLAPPVPGPAL